MKGNSSTVYNTHTKKNRSPPQLKKIQKKKKLFPEQYLSIQWIDYTMNCIYKENLFSSTSYE